MNSNTDNIEILNGKIAKTFFKFTLPNVIGFIAMSSVVIVDSYFVSNYVNAVAFAAVTVTIPLVTIVYGISIMLTIGGAVLIGTYLGEGHIEKASATFTKIVISISTVALTASALCLIFPEYVAHILGANAEIMPYAVPYIKMIAVFFIFQSLEYCLSVIVRTDGSPYIASSAVISGAVINFILDYIFIVKMGMGITGAALGTGISFAISTIILSIHFIMKKGSLYLTKNIGSWKEIIYASYNGSSELLSETSAGIVAWTFNKIMSAKLGTYGIEAFGVINHAIWVTNMLCYAVGDSMVPLLSINYGGKKLNRIKAFIKLARISVLFIGISMFAIFTIIPDIITSLFLDPVAEKEAFNTALLFAEYIKYAFLFIGLNIIISSSFTALQKPLQSVAVAFLRGLSLPVLFILALPLIMGNTGIYIAVPAAEIVTLTAGYIIWKNNSTVKEIYKMNKI